MSRLRISFAVGIVLIIVSLILLVTFFSPGPNKLPGAPGPTDEELHSMDLTLHVVTGSHLEDNRDKIIRENGFPMLIHQSYRSLDALTPRHRYWMRSWETKTANREGWLHVFWTDEENEALVARTLPWMLSTYRNYTHNIQRADIARLAAIREYGGVYADMDYECVAEGCLDIVFESGCGVSLQQGPSPHIDGLFQNTLMASDASPRATDYLTATLRKAVEINEKLSKSRWWGNVGPGSVILSTGPGLYTSIYADFNGVDVSGANGLTHNYDGGRLLKLFKEKGLIPPVKNSLVCLLTEKDYSGQNTGYWVGIKSFHHNAKTWVKAVTDKSSRFSRVLIALGILSAAAYFNSPSVAGSGIVYCIYSGYPATPFEVLTLIIFLAVTFIVGLRRRHKFQSFLLPGGPSS